MLWNVHLHYLLLKFVNASRILKLQDQAALFGVVCRFMPDEWMVFVLSAFLGSCVKFLKLNWKKKNSKVQNQQQIQETTSTLLPFAIVKVLLWRWRDFLGRNSTACLILNCICYLAHRAYYCSASRSQLTTCRRAEAGSACPPRAEGILELQ